MASLFNVLQATFIGGYIAEGVPRSSLSSDTCHM